MDKIFSPIKGRILQYIDFKGIEKKSFYEKTGIAASNFKSSGLKSEIGGDKIAQILSLYNDINAEWLLIGKGNMLKNEEKKEVTQNILGHNNTMIGNDLITDNSLTIKVLMAQIEDCKKIIEEKDSQINKLLNLMSYEKK